MKHVRRGAQPRTAHDFESGSRRRYATKNLSRRAGREDQRTQDFEIRQRDRVAVPPIPGDRQSHLDERGAGQQNLSLDPMIREGWLKLRIEMGSPLETGVVA